MVETLATLCRLQEVNQSWDKSPTIAANVGALSSDCRDLLDKIFVVDPKERITVAEIMKHPWFCSSMAEPYASSLEKMRSQNEALAEHMSKRELDQVSPGLSPLNYAVAQHATCNCVKWGT